MATTRQYVHPQRARRRPSAGGTAALLILGYAVAAYAKPSAG